MHSNVQINKCSVLIVNFFSLTIRNMIYRKLRISRNFCDTRKSILRFPLKLKPILVDHIVPFPHNFQILSLYRSRRCHFSEKFQISLSPGRRNSSVFPFCFFLQKLASLSFPRKPCRHWEKIHWFFSKHDPSACDPTQRF